ncbi:MAG TPA: HD domain-containing protein [Methanomassiliicoccales archaeon]|nr:HD domain-containing protein [Methanomassiliicoccales archaeon]
MPGFKVIHDSVHGSVRVEGLFLRLLGRPEMQRLHGVHQLGLAHLVFPGANHTRLEHSLGTFHIASLMADSLHLKQGERREVLAAALLHDVGHPPFSHTLEEVMADRLGVDHIDLSRQMIKGELRSIGNNERRLLQDTSSVQEVLEEEGISPEKVASLVVSPVSPDVPGQSTLDVEAGQAHFGQDNYLHQIIHGPVDADQMDYLLRDAHYTGVAHGTIDLDRLLQTIGVYHGDLVVHKGGVAAVEGLLVARALMYSSVYFHKTVRIAEMMLCKAVEMADASIVRNLHVDNDGSLTEKLLAQGGYPGKIMVQLKYRELYKRSFSLSMVDMGEEQMERLIQLIPFRRRKEAEEEIAARAGIHPSEVILDMPSRELLISEPRIGKTEVPILDEDRVRPLSRHSPLAKALQSRSVFDWAIMVSCPERYKAEVAKAAAKLIMA